VTETETESEIRGAIAASRVALQDGDPAALDKLLSDRAGCVYIGTDPDEWSDRAQMLSGISEALTGDDGPLRTELGDISVHVRGDVGWTEGTAKFIAPDGTECPCRITSVCVYEDGAWKVAQTHASIGVPNADMFRR
jgi:ketosteroid isomerase-like protein